jgi:hypothetical protein
MNRDIISAEKFFLVVLGLVGWVAAALFGAIPTTVDSEVPAGGGKAYVKTPSPAGAGAACGFAVAGGLCFLGVAQTARQLQQPARAPGRTNLEAVLDQLRFTGMLTDAEYQAMRQKLAADRPAGDGPIPDPGSGPA